MHHSFARLNRLLPPHSRLSDSLVAEKLSSVVRRLSENISTLLDVKIELKSAAGDLSLTLEAIRDVLSTAQAREVQRNLELDRPNGRARFAEPKSKAKQPRKAKKPSTGTDAKGDPKRASAELKWHEKAGPCRHCGGRHWHRDCPWRKRESAHQAQGGPTGAAALATEAAATDAIVGEALFSGNGRANTVEFTAGADGTALCVRGRPAARSTPHDGSENPTVDSPPNLAELLAHEEFLAASEIRVQDEREHARLFPTSESDEDASQPSAESNSSTSASSGAKARVRYVAFENVWPDRDDHDIPGFEAAVAALNERCRVLERRKEHLRHDVYMGDDKARMELDMLTRESAMDPNEEIRKWRRAQGSSAPSSQDSTRTIQTRQSAAGSGERRARLVGRDRRRLDSGSPARCVLVLRRSPCLAQREGTRSGRCRRHGYLIGRRSTGRTPQLPYVGVAASVAHRQRRADHHRRRHRHAASDV
eukprot:2045073-Pleurochrysis_carterae.AAC.1